jgi:transposase
MNNRRYTPEFEDEAVRQVLGHGHSVPDVSERLGVFAHGLDK